MKQIFNISILLVVLFSASSCYDDMTHDGFTRIYVSGPTTANPETTKTFSVGNTPGTISWQIESGPASITGSSSESEVKVLFSEHGSVRIAVSNGSMKGFLVVKVKEIGVKVSVTYQSKRNMKSVKDKDGKIVKDKDGEIKKIKKPSYGMIKKGLKDTVFFKFDSPLASLPVLTMNGINESDTSAFYKDDNGKAIAPFKSTGNILSGLEKYKNSNTEYYAIYTGGDSNGQPEARFEKVTVVDNYGGEVKDSVYVKLHKVDNTVPTGVISSSLKYAKDGDKVVFTATFTEPVRSKIPPTKKGDYWIRVNIMRETNEYIVAEDSLWATNNSKVWKSKGKHVLKTSGSNEMFLIVVDNKTFSDLVGNEPVVSIKTPILVDNTSPDATSSTATDRGKQSVDIEAIGKDDNSGVVSCMYLVLKDGAKVPTNAAGFKGGVASGSYPHDRGISSHILEAGDYDVYFIAKDRAGNYSDIHKVDLKVAP